MEADISSHKMGISNDIDDSNSVIASIKQKPVILSYGFISKVKYEHKSKNCKIQSVTYNSKTCEYIIVDSRGICAWNNNFAANKTSRLMDFPAYQFNVIKILLYCRPLNLYFALTKEYQLKIYNLNFHETFSIESDTNAIIHMIFNASTDELITASRSEIHVWQFGELSKQNDTRKANYGLVLKTKWVIDHGRLINRITLDEEEQRLYCLSEADIWCYDLRGKFIFFIKKACTTHLSACAYASSILSVVAGSIDGQISVLTNSGGKLHSFYSHSSLITEIMIHPSDDRLFLTSSLDGYVKIFSMDLLEELYSVKVFNEGIEYMSLRSKDLIYCVSTKEIEIFDLNYLFQFWGQLRYPAKTIELVKNLSMQSRVVAVDSNNSMKLFSSRNGKKLCTVLPPPTIDPSNKLIPCVHDRDYNIAYFLVTPAEVWVYTTKTDPACFLAPINLWEEAKPGKTSRELSTTPNADVDIPKFISRSNCNCIEVLQDFFIMEFFDNEGKLQTKCNLLACGMENGDIQVYNPLMSGRKENTITLFKDPIVGLRQFKEQSACLVITKGNEGLILKIVNSNLEVLVSIFSETDVSCFTLKNESLATGFVSGHILIQDLSDRSQRVLTLSKPYLVDHYSGVLSVSYHQTLDIVCSSGNDCCIKIWTLDKHLLCEITIDESLTAACFLNSAGDILLGFKGHIFIVKNKKQLAWLGCKRKEQLDDCHSELDIYESPHIKYELKRPPSPVSDNMENYLVPYEDMMFSTMGNWVVNNEDDFSDNSDSDKCTLDKLQSDDESLAPSDIYQSSRFSVSSIGSRLWGLPSCGASPEGSATASDEDIDVKEEDENESQEKKIELEKQEVDNRSRLDELLALTEQNKTPKLQQKFSHGASKKLKNAKVDSSQFKKEYSKNKSNGSKKVKTTAETRIVSGDQILIESQERRKVIKKVKKNIDAPRRVAPRKIKAEKSPNENTAVEIQSGNENSETSNDSKQFVDGGYSSPTQISSFDFEITDDQEQQPEEYGVSLVKNRVILGSARQKIDNTVISSSENSRPEASTGIQNDRAVELDNSRPGISTAQFESPASSRNSSRTQRTNSALQAEGRLYGSPYPTNDSPSRSPYLAEDDSVLSPNEQLLSEGIPLQGQSEAEADVNISTGSPQLNKYSERRMARSVLSDRSMVTSRTEKSSARVSEGSRLSSLRVKKYKTESKRPSQDVTKTKVVPAYQPGIVGSSKSSQDKNGALAALPQSAAISVRNERVQMRDTSAKRQQQLNAKPRVKDNNIKTTKAKDKVRNLENRRRSSQAVRVPVGEFLGNERFLSSSSIELSKSKLDNDLEDEGNKEPYTDNLLQFCVSALKKKNKTSKRKSATVRVYSAGVNTASEELNVPEENADHRPKTAPGDVGTSFGIESFSKRDFDDNQIEFVYNTNRMFEDSQSPSVESMQFSPLLRYESTQEDLFEDDANSFDEKEFNFRVTISKGGFHSKTEPDQERYVTQNGGIMHKSLRFDESGRWSMPLHTHKQPVKGEEKLLDRHYQRYISPHRHAEIPISIYKKAKESILHRNLSKEKIGPHIPLKMTVSSKRNEEQSNDELSIIRRENSEPNYSLEQVTKDSTSAIDSGDTRSPKTERMAWNSQADLKAISRNDNNAYRNNETERRDDFAKRGLVFVKVSRENEAKYDYEDDEEAFPIINIADLERKDKAIINEEMKGVQSPQDKLLERRALSAKLRRRHESAKFRREVIDQQKRARAQNRSVSPTYSPEYPSEFFADPDDAMQPSCIYEYKKPTPLIDKGKKPSNGNKEKTLRARLSGQAFRYGKPVANDENETVIVDFIRTSLNKKPEEVNLLPRPKSTPSIPAKCHHYVLLTETEKKEQKPSKIEQELLRKRFSEFSLQVS